MRAPAQSRFRAIAMASTLLILIAVVRRASIGADPPSSWTPGAWVLIVLATSGLYRLVAAVLRTTIEASDSLLALLLGRAFVKGTWASLMTTERDKERLVVEKIDQTIDDIAVFGWAYNRRGRLIATWASRSASVSTSEDQLVCFHAVAQTADNTTAESISRLSFDRTGRRTAPTLMRGYMLDTQRGARSMIERAVKLSDELFPLDEARRRALGLFGRSLNDRTDPPQT